MEETEWANMFNEFIYAKVQKMHPPETQERIDEMYKAYCGMGMARDSLLKFFVHKHE